VVVSVIGNNMHLVAGEISNKGDEVAIVVEEV
jgi:hypothetical protein